MDSSPSSLSPGGRHSGLGSPSLSPRRHASAGMDGGGKESPGGSQRADHTRSRSRETSLEREDEPGREGSRWSFADEDGEGEDSADPKESYAANASLHNTRATHRRQPPMTVETFYSAQAEEGGGKEEDKRDGLLDIYCRLNYMRTHDKKFNTLNHVERRQEIAELEKDVKELKKVVQSEKSRGEPLQRGWGAKSSKAAEVQLNLKMKRLATMKAKRCRDLRDDLNLLLKALGDELGAIYPYNESLERMSQRLDQFSWKAPAWIGYRPLLLQSHKNGFYDKWLASGCPEPPHSLSMHNRSADHRGSNPAAAEQTARQEEDMEAERGPEESRREGIGRDNHSQRENDDPQQYRSSSARDFEPFLEEDSLSEHWTYPPEEETSWPGEGAARRREENSAVSGTGPEEAPVDEALSEEVLRIMEAKKRAAMAKREARLQKQRQAAGTESDCVMG